jgi:hypothetical protein
MVCAKGNLYLAVQDLSLNFQKAPALSISRSMDKGKTWTWLRNAPIFSNSAFTTLMFLDYGQDNADSPGGHVYAYGIDHNWRFSDRVADPEEVYLGRVPESKVQDRNAWEFFTGIDRLGNPSWSRDLEERKPVLIDRSRAFSSMVINHRAWPEPMTRIAQGGVFYNRPLKRYIYTSWTRFSWEFYEAPTPWGPWRHFFTKNFGVYPWSEDKHGGYAPTVSTKYVSADGKSFYVQANTFKSGVSRYGLAFRKVRVEPFVSRIPANAPSVASLAMQSDTVVVSYSNHFGRPNILNDGMLSNGSEDSWNGEDKAEDFWGYTWPRAFNINRVEFVTGEMTPDGGWFDDIRAQVRQHGKWIDVVQSCSNQPYPGLKAASWTRHVIAFNDTWGDGVRVIGRPGGRGRYTSVAELGIYYEDRASAGCS